METPRPKPTIDQPSRLPTNKVAFFTLGATLAAWLKLAVVTQWPEFDDPALYDGLPILFGFLMAYFVKDAPNV